MPTISLGDLTRLYTTHYYTREVTKVVIGGGHYTVNYTTTHYYTMVTMFINGH